MGAWNEWALPPFLSPSLFPCFLLFLLMFLISNGYYYTCFCCSINVNPNVIWTKLINIIRNYTIGKGKVAEYILYTCWQKLSTGRFFNIVICHVIHTCTFTTACKLNCKSWWTFGYSSNSYHTILQTKFQHSISLLTARQLYINYCIPLYFRVQKCFLRVLYCRHIRDPLFSRKHTF